MIVRVAPNMKSIVNSMMASLRSPGRLLGLRSTYGTTASPTRISVGKITPAIMGWKYRSSSCRPRKYHGALEGFGVRLGLASSRSGASTNVENAVSSTRTTIIATNSSTSRWGKTFTRSPCSR